MYTWPVAGQSLAHRVAQRLLSRVPIIVHQLALSFVSETEAILRWLLSISKDTRVIKSRDFPIVQKP